MDGPEKRVEVQVASFKHKVVMKTVRINLWKEAYVKVICNCLTERPRMSKYFLQVEVRIGNLEDRLVGTALKVEKRW